MNEKPAWIIAILVVATLSAYYFGVMARPVSLNFVNAIVAFSATFIIGFSFILGPLARIASFFKKQLYLRKPFGLIGFGLAALHMILVVPVQLLGSREITLTDAASLAFAGIAFLIFMLMSLTSNQKWMDKLGYDNWKSLQRTGYIAFIAVLFHIVLLEKGVFLTRITGQIAIGFILLALLLRGIFLALGKKNPEPIQVQ